MNPDPEKQVVDLAVGRAEARAEGALPRGLEAPAVDEWSLRELLLALRHGRAILVGATALGLLLGVAYLMLSTPIYTSSALVQVEDRKMTLAGLEELAGVFGEKTPAETEMEVVRSRTLLGSVVDQLRLDLSARPRTFPVLGAAMARMHRGPAPVAALLHLDRFAWGGERISLTRLDVAEELLGEPLTLVASGDGRYQVLTPEGSARLQGTVGVTGRSVDGDVELFVSDLVARPGTEFLLTRLRRSAVVDDLQRRLRVYERGKRTGMLVLELSGPSSARVTATVSAVAATYLRQNVERRSAAAAKSLEFLESQLPVVKSDLDAAEARLSNYRLAHGTVDLSKETEAVLARSAEVEHALSELELERTELRQRFTDNHPLLLGLAQKAERLRGERAMLTERMRRLPATELETARLQRDVKVGSEIYLLLLNKAQEFRVMKSGTVGNVRIVDQPELPLRPSWPRPAPVLVVGLVLGLGMGAVLAMARRALHDALDDPLELERGTGLPVYAAIPYSAAEAAQRRAARRGGESWTPLALADPEDPAVESLRSLRSALPFALVDARNHLVVITSSAPGAGKSFVSVNLALLLAAAECRVLLLDADLRGGRLHRHFGHACHPGLSDLIRGTTTLAEATRHRKGTSLNFVASGTSPPNPSELLASPRVPQILGEMAAGYDYVIVDSAPVLAVTDPTLLARLAGATLMVVDAGHDTLPDVKTAMTRFAQAGAPVRGVILNGTTVLPSSYERYSRYTSSYTSRRKRA